MGTLRTAVNLVIVPADQLGAAELVWSSPPAWLESFDEELRNYRLTAQGLVPLGDAPAVLAREEGDIFALLSEPTILLRLSAVAEHLGGRRIHLGHELRARGPRLVKLRGAVSHLACTIGWLAAHRAQRRETVRLPRSQMGCSELDNTRQGECKRDRRRAGKGDR
ncbi:hypothetical protein DMC30DRAFT_158788 [Rhodotorula diobovata]|uniref:Uncharacterized protein n=1 Tax=Rhodotorula diobovata TaxID=5288 RepID=A0A5C5FLT8_9BASI|nr:hypothetical protein DMC30DRAFT_158788 [Rhodotorula diobovata]